MAQQMGVKGPDGKTYQFPSDATDDEIVTFFSKQGPEKPPAPTSKMSGLGPVADFGIGLGKSALGLVESGGQLLRKIPGVQAASEAIGEVTLPFSSEPTSTAQSVGKLAGDVGQFFIPATAMVRGTKLAGMAARSPRLAEGVKSAGLSLAQGSGAGGAAVTGALAAALPGGGAARQIGQKLERSAEKSVVQALAPTKEWAKDTAAKIAPEMLSRGVRGTQAQMLGRARQQVRALGQEIGAEVRAAADAGATVSGPIIRAAITDARSALTMADAKGVTRVIEGAGPVVKQLDRLDQFVASLGPDIPFDKAQALKQTWDKIVAKAGLYGQKVGASATDSAKAWAMREATTALRRELSSGSATLAKLNEEFAFWKGLQKVLTETERRTQSHGGGLVSGVGGAIGGGAGFASGESIEGRLTGAFAGAVAGRQIIRLLQSPYWRTSVSAPLKQRFGAALASDNTAALTETGRAILASLPAQVSQRLQESR